MGMPARSKSLADMNSRTTRSAVAGAEPSGAMKASAGMRKVVPEGSVSVWGTLGSKDSRTAGTSAPEFRACTPSG